MMSANPIAPPWRSPPAAIFATWDPARPTPGSLPNGPVRYVPSFPFLKNIFPADARVCCIIIIFYFCLSYYYYQCSEECGTGIQTRKAHCSSNSEMDCDVSKKPDTSRTCVSAKDCSGKWFAGPWSQVFLFSIIFFYYRLTCFGMEAKTNRKCLFCVIYY